MFTWYFAYGSNLKKEQMIARTGQLCHADHPPRVVRLPNYQLVFERVSQAGPVYANIQSPGPGVIGVIYYCSEEQLEKMDSFEGGYVRQTVVVTDEQGEQINAMAYVVPPENAFGYAKPAEEYLTRIVTGAKQHGLPEGEIQKIIAIAETGKL